MIEKIKILIVEDHELTRKGIVYGLNKSEKLEVVGEASNGQEGLDVFISSSPDVVLMDIAIPIINGIKLTKKIKKLDSTIKVIMLTSYHDKEKVFGAFTAGADAYCLKDVKLPTLNKIIEIVKDGGIWLDPQIAHIVIDLLDVISKVSNGDEDASTTKIKFDLTSREKEILKMIANGKNNKYIADELCLSIYTVKNHVSSIIGKLAVDDRTQAAILALKKGLI